MSGTASDSASNSPSKSASNSVSGAADSVNSSAKQAANSRVVKIGARIGILAYGVTHLLIAWLALQVAFGSGGQADQNGAFAAIARQPFGQVLIWIVVVGFVAVGLWRLEQAIWGYAYVSDRAKNIRKRATAGGKAVLFLVLAFIAGRTAVGSGGGGGGQQQGAAADLLGIPGGQFIVGAIGLAVIAAGVVKAVEGWTKKFEEDMELPSDQRARDVAVRTGQVGFIAKGVSTALIGGLFVAAAIQFRPEEAAGLDAALKTLAQQPFGPYLLILVALGLAAYGVFCFFDARYHRV